MSEIHLPNRIECVRDVPCRGALEPVHRQRTIYRRSHAVTMHHAEFELSFCQALLGGSAQPSKGCEVIARNPFSPCVNESKPHLRDGLSPFRQWSKHFDGARIIVHGISNKRICQFVGCCGLIA